MTRILFHPHLAPPHHGELRLLPAPWVWWTRRVYPNAERDQTLMYQHYETEPDDGSIRTFDITFGEDWDGVTLTDPPAMHVRIHRDEPDFLYDSPLRTIRIGHEHMTVQVVWHEQPGERWEPMFNRVTCIPGDYQISDSDDMLERFRARFHHRTPPLLRWPVVATVRSPQPVFRPHDRCMQCSRHLTESTRLGGFCTTCAHMRTRAGYHDFAREYLNQWTDSYTGRGDTLGFDETGYVASNVGQGGHSDTCPRHAADIEPIDEPPLVKQGRRPEQDVLDAIDELVDEQLSNWRNRSGYDHNINQETCPVCKGRWHGLNDLETGCPGAFADVDEIAAWRSNH